MHTRVDAGQSVVNAGLSGVDDAGQSRRMKPACNLHAGCRRRKVQCRRAYAACTQAACRLHKAIYAACMSIVKYA